MSVEPIDPEWVKKYVDQLLECARKFNTGPMRDAMLLRADHVLDMVKAWKERKR